MPGEVQTEQLEYTSGLFTEPTAEIIEVNPEVIITEERGRVVSLTIPQELINNPPSGADRRQLEFIQAVSDAGILVRIRPASVRRMVRYYCTEARIETIATEEDIALGAISQTIHRGMLKAYRLLWPIWFKKYNSPLPFNEKFPFEVILRVKGWTRKKDTL